jgi:hypothetical protein
VGIISLEGIYSIHLRECKAWCPLGGRHKSEPRVTFYSIYYELPRSLSDTFPTLYIYISLKSFTQNPSINLEKIYKLYTGVADVTLWLKFSEQFTKIFYPGLKYKSKVNYSGHWTHEDLIFVYSVYISKQLQYVA